MVDDDNELENAENDTDETEEMELTETQSDPAVELEPGYHVYVDGNHNSGPYTDHAAAQTFIDSHLSGDGEIRVVE